MWFKLDEIVDSTFIGGHTLTSINKITNNCNFDANDKP